MRLFRCFLALLLLVPGLAAAKVLTFADQKCQIEIPDDWVQIDQPPNLVTVATPDHSKAFGLSVFPSAADIILTSPSYIRNVRIGMTNNGIEVGDDQLITQNQLQFREFLGSRASKQDTAHLRSLAILANGYSYGLATMKLNADPAQDDDLNKIISSFAFIGAPQIHQRVPWSFLHPFSGTDWEEKSHWEKVGFALGYLFGLAILPIALVIFIVVRVVRSRSDY